MPFTSENIEAFTKAGREGDPDVVQIDGRRYDVERGDAAGPEGAQQEPGSGDASKMMVGSLRSALEILNADRQKGSGRSSSKGLTAVQELKRKKLKQLRAKHARPLSAGTTVSARRRKRSISKVAFLKRKAKAAAGAAAAASSPIATSSPKKKSSSAMSRQARLNFEPPKKRSSASKHLYMLMTVQVRSDFVFASLLLLQHTRLPNLFIYHFSF